jgi:hypothetical protein
MRCARPLASQPRHNRSHSNTPRNRNKLSFPLSPPVRAVTSGIATFGAPGWTDPPPSCPTRMLRPLYSDRAAPPLTRLTHGSVNLLPTLALRRRIAPWITPLWYVVACTSSRGGSKVQRRRSAHQQREGTRIRSLLYVPRGLWPQLQASGTSERQPPRAATPVHRRTPASASGLTPPLHVRAGHSPLLSSPASGRVPPRSHPSAIGPPRSTQTTGRPRRRALQK